MRKQTKIVALAAVLALGASFTSMAATYDWKMEDDGWYCYDEDGEAYDEEWVESYGYDYWVDDEGKMVTSSWVEDGDDLYYVNSEGKKTISDWKFTYAMDEEDDDDAEEAWFYFDSKGKLATDKRIAWKDSYYFVDKDGKMVTGWIEYDKAATEVVKTATANPNVDNLIYVNEDGTRAANMWYHGFEAGLDEEATADLDEDSYVYYWINKDGSVATGKKSDINGETYFFGEDGIMLYGWVVTVNGSGVYANVPKTATLSQYASGYSVYFCGNDDQGWAKKGDWYKLANNQTFEDADEDTTTYWFSIGSNGKVFIPNVTASGSNASVGLVKADAVTFNGSTGFSIGTPANANNAELKVIKGETYMFDANGQMLKGLYYVDNELNYFGTSDEGQRKTGTCKVEDTFEDAYEVTFAKKDSAIAGEYSKYEALNGNVDGYLYINGRLQKSSEKGIYKYVTVGNDKFLVNYKGKVQTDLTDKYELETGEEVTPGATLKLGAAGKNSIHYGALVTK